MLNTMLQCYKNSQIIMCYYFDFDHITIIKEEDNMVGRTNKMQEPSISDFAGV